MRDAGRAAPKRLVTVYTPCLLPWLNLVERAPRARARAGQPEGAYDGRWSRVRLRPCGRELGHVPADATGRSRATPVAAACTWLVSPSLPYRFSQCLAAGAPRVFSAGPRSLQARRTRDICGPAPARHRDRAALTCRVRPGFAPRRQQGRGRGRGRGGWGRERGGRERGGRVSSERGCEGRGMVTVGRYVYGGREKHTLHSIRGKYTSHSAF